MRILDFRFWIFDFGLRIAHGTAFSALNPKSRIQNPK